MATVIERRKFTVPQLAKAWGVSANKVLAFIQQGELRATNFATRIANRPRYLIDVDDIRTFENQRLVVPQPTRTAPRSKGSVKKFY